MVAWVRVLHGGAVSPDVLRFRGQVTLDPCSAGVPRRPPGGGRLAGFRVPHPPRGRRGTPALHRGGAFLPRRHPDPGYGLRGTSRERTSNLDHLPSPLAPALRGVVCSP